MDRTHQQIVESTTAGILVLDGGDFSILDVNRAACNILSLTPQELLGSRIASFFPESENWIQQFRDAAEHPDSTYPVELVLPSGKRLRIRYSFAPVVRDSVYLCTLLPPESEGIETEFLVRLLAMSPDPLFLMDDTLHYRYFFWGRGSEFGILEGSLTGKTVHDFLSPVSAEKENTRYREVLASGKPLQYRSRVRINGSVMVFFTRLSPVLDAEGRVQVIFGISRDITEQEKEKREANQLEKEIDYRKDFVMTAAHELRTPLQPILGYLHLLLDDPEYFGLTAETGKMLRTCLDNVERERHIVDRMLELSLLYAEKISINPTDVALKPLVADIVRTGEYDHQAEIAIDIPEGAHLVADRDCLYTVLECLISNAIRFNNPPRHVGICYQEDGSYHQISVEDDGIGISPSKLHAIFEPFHLADAEKLSRQYNRIGLALSIARKYITLHGGTIDVNSTVGEGSTFTVRIPLEVPYGL
jgi:PAS domain S-box-containing protein